MVTVVSRFLIFQRIIVSPINFLARTVSLNDDNSLHNCSNTSTMAAKGFQSFSKSLNTLSGLLSGSRDPLTVSVCVGRIPVRVLIYHSDVLLPDSREQWQQRRHCHRINLKGPLPASYMIPQVIPQVFQVWPLSPAPDSQVLTSLQPRPSSPPSTNFLRWSQCASKNTAASTSIFLSAEIFYTAQWSTRETPHVKAQAAPRTDGRSTAPTRRFARRKEQAGHV